MPRTKIIQRLSLPVIIIFFCIINVFAGEIEKLNTYQLEVDRYGPVQIGMTPQEASTKLGISLVPADLPSEEDIVCHYVYPEGKFDDVGFMVEYGHITRIDIYSKKISSVGAIHIGDSETAVKQAFPGKVKEEIHPYIGSEGKYLIVETKKGFAFVFETDRGKVTTFRAGRLSSVQYIEGCL